MKMLAMLVVAGVWAVLLAAAPVPRGGQTEVPKADPNRKPTLFLIGDSTVRNGADNGSNGQWGWGHLLPYYFDRTKINVENLAVGGTSSRTFIQNPRMWPAILPRLQAGDYVMMQFGHNDNTARPEADTTRWRSTLPGNGEETVQGLVQGGGTETVHSFGWYMRKFISETKSKGATPIVCSLIPRNRWTGGKVNRNDKDYALWAKEAADEGGALFLPLGTLIADKYDTLGKEKVTAELFPPGEVIHPNWAGSKLNAECVVEGLKALDTPLKGYLLANAKAPDVPDVAAPARGVRGGGARGAATMTGR
jgi:lysophospholipase L1-like esterase